MVACQKGDFEAGLQDFRELTVLEPSTDTAWLNLGKCQRDSGDSAGAIASLSRALEISPEMADAQILLGLSQRDSGDGDNALTTLEDAVQRHPQHLAGITALAMQYQSMGRAEDALAQFTTARDLQPTMPHTHYNLGRAQLEANQMPEARESFEQALTINHHYHQARLGLAELAQRQGDADTAINIYRRLTRRAPRLHQAHVSMMALLISERRASELQNQMDYSESLFAETDFPRFWQAELMALRGNTQRALEQLKLLREKPQPLLDPKALDNAIERLTPPTETSS